MVITFASSDGQIWNKDQLIIGVMNQIRQGYDKIIVASMGEGPCAQSLGLYDILDMICSNTGFPCENIMIRTSNLVENHSRYHIQIDVQTAYLEEAKKFNAISPKKNWDLGLMKFGNFIGHGNYPRLFLSGYLHKHCSNQVLQTYHTTVGDHYHRPFIGIEDLLFFRKNWNDFDTASNLLRSSPIVQDLIESYPIVKPTTFNITKLYPDFFVEICCLTYYTGDTFYIDEKIWRPMLMKTPFIVQGPRNFLSRLKSLGFKTFDAWWDEGYSEDHLEDQLDGITRIIDEISKWDQIKIKKTFDQMQENLEHNYQRMITIASNDMDIFRAR